MAEEIPKVELDLTGLQSQVANLQRSYTEFGATVQDIAVGTAQDVSSFYDLTLGMDLPISSALASLPEPAPLGAADQGRIAFYLEAQQREARRIVENLATMKEVKLDKVFKKKPSPQDPQHQSVESAIGMAERDMKSAKEEVKGTFKETMKASEGVFGVRKEAAKESREATSKIEAAVLKAYEGIGDLLKKLPDKLSRLGGGFVSGLFGALSIGYREKDRKRAELGEMANVFQSSFDSLMSGKTQRAVRNLSSFAEHAQWRYRLARKDVQATAKLLVDAGVEADDFLKEFDKGLGGVGDNVVKASLALDKHFHVADGTSMQRAVEFMHNYAMGAHEALKSYMKIAGAAQRSRIGTEKFIGAVLDSEDALRKLGGNVEFVAVMVNRITDHYEEMGLNRKFAGRQAVGVAVNLLEAFQNIGDKLKIELMRDITGDEQARGLDLVQQFKDGLSRLKEGGGSDEFLEKLLKAFSNVVMRQLAGSRAQRIMAVSDILSVSVGDAALIHDLTEELGEVGKLADLDKSQVRNLKDAFGREREAVSTLDVTRRELIDMISGVSEGLFGILTNIVALLIVGVKTFPALYYGFKSGEVDLVMDRLWEKVSSIWRDMGTNWQKIEDSLYNSSQKLSAMFPGTVGTILNLFFGRQKYYEPPRQQDLDKLASMSPEELQQSERAQELAEQYMRGEAAPQRAPDWMKKKTESGDLVWMNQIAIDPYTGRRWSPGGRELERISGTYDPTAAQSVESALGFAKNMGEVVPGLEVLAPPMTRFVLNETGILNVEREGRTHGEIIRDRTRDHIKEQAKRRAEQDTEGKFTLRDYSDDTTAGLSGDAGVRLIPASLAVSGKKVLPPG